MSAPEQEKARAEAGVLLYDAGLRGLSSINGRIQSVLQGVLLRAWRAEAALKEAQEALRAEIRAHEVTRQRYCRACQRKRDRERYRRKSAA